jgi:hypothetical protein
MAGSATEHRGIALGLMGDARMDVADIAFNGLVWIGAALVVLGLVLCVFAGTCLLAALLLWRGPIPIWPAHFAAKPGTEPPRAAHPRHAPRASARDAGVLPDDGGGSRLFGRDDRPVTEATVSTP